MGCNLSRQQNHFDQHRVEACAGFDARHDFSWQRQVGKERGSPSIKREGKVLQGVGTTVCKQLEDFFKFVEQNVPSTVSCIATERLQEPHEMPFFPDFESLRGGHRTNLWCRATKPSISSFWSTLGNFAAIPEFAEMYV